MKNIHKTVFGVTQLLHPTTEELATAVGNGQPEVYTEPAIEDGTTVDLDDVQDFGREYLPQGWYTLVCIGAEFVAKSKSSGQPMVTFEWEVIAPKSVVHKGVEQKAEGTKLLEYVSMQPQALGKVKALHRTLRLPMKGFNPRNPQTNAYLGLAMTAVLSTKQKVMNKEGTNEPLLDPETNKPISDNEYKIARYGAAAPEFNRSIPY